MGDRGRVVGVLDQPAGNGGEVDSKGGDDENYEDGGDVHRHVELFEHDLPAHWLVVKLRTVAMATVSLTTAMTCELTSSRLLSACSPVSESDPHVEDHSECGRCVRLTGRMNDTLPRGIRVASGVGLFGGIEAVPMVAVCG